MARDRYGKAIVYIDHRCYIVVATAKAILVSEYKDKADQEDNPSFWLPKSQVRVEEGISDDDPSLVNVRIPEWLAKEKELL